MGQAAGGQGASYRGALAPCPAARWRVRVLVHRLTSQEKAMRACRQVEEAVLVRLAAHEHEGTTHLVVESERV